MNYRIIYTLSNIELDENTLNEYSIKKITDKKDMDIIFTDDVLHVISEEQKNIINNQKNMYGFIIDNPTNIINKISNIFQIIQSQLSDAIIALDSGSMKYLNKAEIVYYSKNKYLIDKLFTVEISSSEYHTTYITKGLKSLGINEIQMSTNSYFEKKVYQKFKEYVSNSIANGNFELFMLYGDVNTIDEEELLHLNIAINKRLKATKQKHLEDNYQFFKELYHIYKDDSRFNFTINNNQIDYELAPDYIPTIHKYNIAIDDMIYDEINIFYMQKYIN